MSDLEPNDALETDDIACLLLPMQTLTLLVPTVTIAEMAPVAPIFPDNSGPDWFLGYYNWRSERVPLMSFERIVGESAAGIHPNGRIAVFNCTGLNSNLPFIALPTQGIPRMVRVEEQDIIVNDSAGKRPFELLRAHLGMEEFVIPDVAALERAFADYKYPAE